MLLFTPLDVRLSFRIIKLVKNFDHEIRTNLQIS